MGLISAKLGAVSTGSSQAAVKDITIDYDAANVVYGTSGTAGGVGRIKGVSDWRATFTIYGATANMYPGTGFTLTAYDGAGSWSGTAIVEEMTIEADIKGGGLISATVTVASNGLLTRGTTSVTDSATPAPVSAKGVKVTYDGTDRPHATGWRLTLRSENKPYHSSGTYDVATDTNYAGRIAGRKDASGSWTELEALGASMPRDGETTKILKLYVNATEFWEIKWPTIDSVSTPVAVEAGDIVEPTVNWSFNGYSGGVGYINKPDASAWWP